MNSPSGLGDLRLADEEGIEADDCHRPCAIVEDRGPGLTGVVEGGDGKPTAQSYAVFKELSARLDQQLAKLEAVANTDLPMFNREIARKQLSPVK